MVVIAIYVLKIRIKVGKVVDILSALDRGWSTDIQHGVQMSYGIGGYARKISAKEEESI